MSGNLADVEQRQSKQRRATDNRSGVLPENRNTRAPAFQGFARMASAQRGDVGGAEELMRTLGMVTKAAQSFQGYAQSKFEKDEEERGGQGAVDQAAGTINAELVEKSGAYRRAVELGREQTRFPAAVNDYQDDLGGIIEHQDSSDLTERRAEVDGHIDHFLQSYALDPETGKLRDTLKSPEAMRWLAGAMGEYRTKLTAAAHARIDARFAGESLTNVGTLLGSQLDTGTMDVAALRAILPPTVSDDALRGTILETFQGKAEALKAAGRYEESYRIIGQVLGIGAVTHPAAIPTDGVAQRPAGTPSVAKRRSRDEVIGFVLNKLEGGPVVVNNGDGGGTTKYGITARHNPGVDVANLSFDQASAIAREKYWQAAYDKAHPAVAAIAFDAGFINSKAFGRELATKYANDPAGALQAYRQRLQDIAQKPDKARFLTPWMNRIDRLASYLGAGGANVDSVVNDPSFARDADPLDPVEAADRNPGLSFAPLLSGGLAIRPDERTKLLQYRDQLGREVRQEWTRERREKQDTAHADFMLRLSGLGPVTTPAEISEATRNGTIRPEDAVSLLNVIRADADRDEQRAERAVALADRNRDKAEEKQAEGIVASLMGPVYSGNRAPGEALRLFDSQAAMMNPRVRRAVLGAMNAEANGIEALRKSNPAFVAATDKLDDQEQEALRRIRGPYRDPATGRTMGVETQRAIVSLEFGKAKRALARHALDKGDIGALPSQLDSELVRKLRPYFARPAAR